MTFIDVGSNVGLFAIPAALKVGEGGRVFAFEPSTSTYTMLLDNAALNPPGNIVAIPKALGDRTGSTTLHINAPGLDALNTIVEPSHPNTHVVGSQSVQVLRLDDFLTDQRIEHVDVMKVDVEGAELLVFRGARELLERQDAPIVVYEAFEWTLRGAGQQPAVILKYMESLGFANFFLDTKTGRLAPCATGDRRSGMVVSVKRQHPGYEQLAARGSRA